MTQILRQSTQVIVRIGPAVAVGDGFTPVTTLDLSTADEAELLKANTTTTTSIAAATFAAITGCDGWYGLTLTTSLTDTVGCLDVMVNDDSLILPIFARFQVIEEAAYDAMYAASADPKADINVASIDAGAITAAAIATDAIDADALADGAITAATFAAGAITATVIATGAIDADALAADTITAAKVAADVSAEIADAVWDEDATGHQTGGTFGQAIGDPAADTNTIYGAVVTGAAGATIAADIIAVQADTDDIQTRLPAALVSGRIDASVGAMASNVITAAATAADFTTEVTSGLALEATLSTVAGYLDTEIAAIKAKTDSLTFTVAGQVDSNIQSVNDITVNGNGAGTPWGP